MEMEALLLDCWFFLSCYMSVNINRSGCLFWTGEYLKFSLNLNPWFKSKIQDANCTNVWLNLVRLSVLNNGTSIFNKMKQSQRCLASTQLVTHFQSLVSSFPFSGRIGLELHLLLHGNDNTNNNKFWGKLNLLTDINFIQKETFKRGAKNTSGTYLGIWVKVDVRWMPPKQKYSCDYVISGSPSLSYSISKIKKLTCSFKFIHIYCALPIYTLYDGSRVRHIVKFSSSSNL